MVSSFICSVSAITFAHINIFDKNCTIGKPSSSSNGLCQHNSQIELYDFHHCNDTVAPPAASLRADIIEGCCNSVSSLISSVSAITFALFALINIF